MNQIGLLTASLVAGVIGASVALWLVEFLRGRFHDDGDAAEISRQDAEREKMTV